MNRKITTLLFAVAASTVFALLHCSSPLAGNGSGIGNGVVASMLHNPGGSPAKNAKVVFYPVNYNPHTGGLGKTATAATPDSTTTDNNGNYTITLDTGSYNVLANGDSGLAYQDSITTIKGDTVKPPPDTLKPAGTIQGIIQMQPGDDPRTVFILFMGTHTFTMPVDIAGNFTTDNMAAGTYSVRIITTTPNYKVLDTNLSVIAGTVNVLPAPIVLQYTGIPVPTGLKITYDTMKQIVTLIWNKPINGRIVQSYTIYRKLSDSANFVNIKGGVTDTTYNDSTGVQDMTYEYRVAVVDTNASEGTKSAAVSVTILPALQFVKNVGSSGSGTGQYAAPVASCITPQNELLVVDYKRGVVLRFDTMGNFQNEVSGFIAPVGVASFTDTTFLVGDDMSATQVLPGIVKLVDLTGMRIFQILGSDSLSGKFGQQSAPWGFAVSLRVGFVYQTKIVIGLSFLGHRALFRNR